MEQSTNTLFTEEIIIPAVIIGFFLFIAFLVNFYIPFKETRDYIKREISRSQEKEERKFWKNEMRKLYLSALPIIGRFFDE